MYTMLSISGTRVLQNAKHTCNYRHLKQLLSLHHRLGNSALRNHSYLELTQVSSLLTLPALHERWLMYF
jgi:hypothetical protein